MSWLRDGTYFGSGRTCAFSPGLRNHRLVPSLVLKKFSRSAVVFRVPASLGCRRSARTSHSVQTNPSSLRGELLCAHSKSGALISPRSGSKFSWASPLTWLCTTQRLAKPDS